MYMKKRYVKPQMEVVMISQRENLLGANEVDGNLFSGSITRGSGEGRSRDYDMDDEDWY